MVSHLIGRIGKLNNDFLGTGSNTPETDCKTVAAHNREYNSNCTATQLSLHIGRNIGNSSIVTLSPGYNSLGHSHNITVSDRKSILFRSLKNSLCDNLHQIITFADNRGTKTSRNSSNHSTHKNTPYAKTFKTLHSVQRGKYITTAPLLQQKSLGLLQSVQSLFLGNSNLLLVAGEKLIQLCRILFLGEQAYYRDYYKATYHCDHTGADR